MSGGKRGKEMERKVLWEKAEPARKGAGFAVRQRAAVRLDAVLRGQAFSPFGPEEIKEGRDRALANRLVTLALRRHGHLNRVMGALLERGVPKRSGLFEAALRLGLAQLLFLPEAGAHSAVHLAVEVVRADRRASRFHRLLNGVLRQAQREQEIWRHQDSVLLFPPWLAGAWAARYGRDNLERFATALLEGAPLDLTLKGAVGGEAGSQEGKENPDRLPGAVRLMADSVRVARRDRPVEDMAGYRQGEWWVQDVAAAIPARLFTLEKGARVLDMCAAPGGKSAQLVKAGYRVTALDNSPARLERLRENLVRLDYQARIVLGDATTFAVRDEEKYDGILIDAPCTATGTFRRHPEVLWHRSEEDVKNRVLLQRSMIRNGLACLGAGGQLVLCVCSLLEEEGEAQARWVSHNFPQLELVPITQGELAGLEGALTGPGWLRTHPGLDPAGGVKGGMDGFFAARWVLRERQGL